MFKKRLQSLYCGLLTLSLSGCHFFPTFQYEVVGDKSSLEGLSKIHAARKLKHDESSNALRLQSVRDYAFSMGAQAGCAQHTHQLKNLLNKLDNTLNRVYSFSGWMLPHNVLPPVLIDVENTIRLTDSQTMRIADRIYHIYKNAKFVSNPPHWRYDYLLRDASHIMNKPPELVTDLLPKNKEEQRIWKEAVKEGWQSGVEQARNNFMINLHALARDLNGMMLYHRLLIKQMVSAPYVAYSNLGITGDDKNMHIQDQMLRITTLSTLNHEVETWKPVVIHEQPQSKNTAA